MESALQVLDEVLLLPTSVIRPPQLRLRIPRVSKPSAWIVFAIAFLTYFLVSSGIIYDVIAEPPGYGGEQDPNTGRVKPIVFLMYRLNGQYIIEGLSAGLLFAIGGLGFILLDKSNDKFVMLRTRWIMIVFGVVCLVVAYPMSIVFLRMKLPGYQRTHS